MYLCIVYCTVCLATALSLLLGRGWFLGFSLTIIELFMLLF